MYKWVTPSLAVCDEADWPERFRIGEAKSAADWVLAGGDAYVDSDETAALVLSCLGLTKPEVEDRLRFANTGIAS